MPSFNPYPFIERYAEPIAHALAETGRVIEKTHLAPNIAATLENAPKALEKMPFNLIKQQTGFVERVAEKAVRITSFHDTPKIAKLGRAIEEMLEHPLVGKFKRNKYHFFITPDPDFSWISKGVKGDLEYLSKIGYHSPGNRGMKIVEIPRHYFENFTIGELKGLAGHEIGHMLRADQHPRRGAEAFFGSATQDAEKAADLLGGFISGEPEELASALRKQIAHMKQSIKDMPRDGFVARYLKTKTSRKLETASHLYPSLAERTKALEELAARMKTPEGYTEVHEELVHLLKTEHEKLFSHHYARPNGVTRG